MKTTDVPEPERLLVPMNFTSVSSIADAKMGDTVSTNISVTGPNGCYKLEGFDARANGIGPNTFDILAVGSVPNPAKGDTTCPGSVYTKDTTFRFRLPSSGQYILRYYNNTTLFKADTIEVSVN